MSSELFLRVEQEENLARVLLEGEIDIYTAGKFKEKLYDVIDAQKKDLVIDCARLNYIDSTGLGIFVGALKKTKLNGNDIHIQSLKDNIKKLFLITGLDKLFIIE